MLMKDLEEEQSKKKKKDLMGPAMVLKAAYQRLLTKAHE